MRSSFISEASVDEQEYKGRTRRAANRSLAMVLTLRRRKAGSEEIVEVFESASSRNRCSIARVVVFYTIEGTEACERDQGARRGEVVSVGSREDQRRQPQKTGATSLAEGADSTSQKAQPSVLL